MYALNSQPAVFKRPMVKLCSKDRLQLNGRDWIPVTMNADGWHLRSEDATGRELFVSHEEIHNDLSAKRGAVKYGYHEIEQQKFRAVFGDKQFSDFSNDAQLLALLREKLIKKYDEAYPEQKRRRWNHDELSKKLRGWYFEIQDDLAPKGKRADQATSVAYYSTPSVKTFWRDYNKYYDGGCDVLALVQRHHGPGVHLRSIDPDSMAFAHKEAERYMERTRPTISHLYRQYLAALAVRNASEERPLVKVSRWKFSKIIDKFDEFAKVAGRHGEAQARKKFSSIKQSFDVQAPGDRIEIDFWNVDLVSLLSQTGMWKLLPEAYRAQLGSIRVWFVAAIDVATRYVLALKPSTSANSMNAIEAIRMIMMDKTFISDQLGCATPWIGRLRPRCVYSDNGSEFVSSRTQEVLRNAKIAFVQPPAGRPQSRPFIERLFRSIGPMVAQEFDGRTFGSIAEKGDYNPEAHLSLQTDELIKLLTIAVCDIYHRAPHSGLGGRSPHDVWVQKTQTYPINFPPNDEEMLHIFGEKIVRRISTNGVTFMGIPYRNEELARLYSKEGQVEFEVKYDPADLRAIAVRNPKKGWFRVENTIKLDECVSLEEWISARQKLRIANAKESESGLDAMYVALRFMRESGETARLRARLNPRALEPKQIDTLESELCGSWVAQFKENTKTLGHPVSVPSDILVTSAAESIADYHSNPRKWEVGAKESPTTRMAEVWSRKDDGEFHAGAKVSSKDYYDEF
ncbi:Mu transposase C-terminal domain-containing protein [Brucella thiophenivorans]|uniref:Mu transposase, C-terminal family protein n=1 Tax=Brucella thiophenivorans TaxID=571255 RepID=A0A256FJW9_9HYPH|nr:Mu transposase C-terminal domain-containing protein [Brucella thiophenivorans]OYR15127.1 mu transposase, C-terminal family protein [Brucella thiophenivorans]